MEVDTLKSTLLMNIQMLPDEILNHGEHRRWVDVVKTDAVAVPVISLGAVYIDIDVVSCIKVRFPC